MDVNGHYNNHDAGRTKNQPASRLTQDRKPRILIVDDEESILWSLSRTLTLSNEEYIIGTASSAEEALDILQSTKVDVIVTDLKLPKMNGLELAKHLHVSSPETQTILMTAYGDEGTLKKANAFGCSAYIEKPFAIDLLVEHINNALHPKEKSNIRVELTGIQIIDLLQLYALKKLSASLNIATQNGLAKIVIDNGVICHAEYNKQDGPQALLSILQCSDAVVRSQSRMQIDRRTLAVTLQDLQAVSQLSSEAQKLRLFRGDDIVLPTLPEEPKKKRRSARNKEKEKAIAQPLPPEPPIAEKMTEEITVGKYQLHSIVSALSDETFIPPPNTGQQILRVKAEEESEVPPKNEESNDSDSEEELILNPEPSPPPPITIPSRRDERLGKIRHFVNSGIEHFKNHDLEQAKKCWLLALRFDENCAQAKRNLEILQKVVHEKSL